MVNSEWSDLSDDYREDFRAPPPRTTRLLPAVTVIAFAFEVVTLLLAWSHSRGTGNLLFRDAPIFLLAALPYLAMAGIGLLVPRERAVHAGLLPVLVILTLVGVWAAATKTTQTRGGFEGIGLVLAYLFQWAMVGLSVLVGFVTLATTRH